MNISLIPDAEALPIMLRGYAHSANKGKGTMPGKSDQTGLDEPSDRVLVFDTETTTDASQAMRLGTYQVWQESVLEEKGVFYDPLTLPKSDIQLLIRYAEKHGLTSHTLESFIEAVFFAIAYDLRASIVGFNLPFDISRLASHHSTAKSRSMRGGFTFCLSSDMRRPYVQIKHLSRSAALIRFAAPARQNTSRGMRNREIKTKPPQGYFVDLKTIAAALTGKSWSLASLSKELSVDNPKLSIEEHGTSLTDEYLDYAIRDTQTTWECFVALRDRYAQHGLTTPLHRIFSAASLGKAYLKEMNVTPWRESQPEFPDALLGTIMSTYYGGRSEVHIRRQIVPVAYCDFRSMYPTVCTLMGLWRWIIAEGMEWKETKEETNKLLECITLKDLQNPAFWPQLCTLVRVKPDADVLPIRAKYDGEQANIGLNHLTSEEQAIWFTLADCIASKLLTGKLPEVVEAITFFPKSIQKELKPIAIAGNAAYSVDPRKDDFFQSVIKLRLLVKKQQKNTTGEEAARLDTEQTALKILANATSYGVYMELNVEDLARKTVITCIRENGESFPVPMDKHEKSGKYFNPILGSLIAGAARLMLATTERLILDSQLDWAFCDTDSMAIVQPETMQEHDFMSRVESIQEWFTPLNPYGENKSILQMEDANFNDSGSREILYCLTLSAKRYALFNLDKAGKPILRKASAHGLGHLLSPYEKNSSHDASVHTASINEIGVESWQADLWRHIITQTLAGNPTQYNPADLPSFDKPATSRYAATTPELLKWYKLYNEEKPYHKQLRPFGFMLSFQPKNTIFNQRSETDSNDNKHHLRPVAPYDKDTLKAVKRCFDRLTGKQILQAQLKTYREALAQYHLHPEAKFLNGDAAHIGITQRRHISVREIHYIGKEADRWEEQYFLGFDPEAQIEYGTSPQDKQKQFERIVTAAKTYGKTHLAATGSISCKHLAAILQKTTSPSLDVLVRLAKAAEVLAIEKQKKEEHKKALLNRIRSECNDIGLRQFAKKVSIDAGNLQSILSGRRQLGEITMEQINYNLSLIDTKI